MGYNTTVIVMNDAIGAIESDPDFGAALSVAISEAASTGRRVDVAAGNYCNAAHVVESHHADETSVITVGGNLGLRQLITYGYRHDQVEQQKELVRAWAKKLGMEVVDKKA